MSQMRYYNGVKYSVSSFFKEFLNSDTMINELIGLIEEYGNTNSSWYKKLISLGPHEYIDDKTAEDLMAEVKSNLLKYTFSKKSEIPLALDEIMADLQHKYNIRKYKASKRSYEGDFWVNIYFNGDAAQYQLTISCRINRYSNEVYNDAIKFYGYGDIDNKQYESLGGIGMIL